MFTWRGLEYCKKHLPDIFCHPWKEKVPLCFIKMKRPRKIFYSLKIKELWLIYAEYKSVIILNIFDNYFLDFSFPDLTSCGSCSIWFDLKLNKFSTSGLRNHSFHLMQQNSVVAKDFNTYARFLPHPSQSQSWRPRLG